MTSTLTTTATRVYYADAISDAIAEAEAILGPLVVTRIECVADDPIILGAHSVVRAPYTATVEAVQATPSPATREDH